jgi:hypothetical protein
MSLDHQKFHFSVTCHTTDPAVVFCLRALCQFTEKHPKQQIGWGGTGSKEWKDAGNTLTLRFTEPDYRDAFTREGERLLAGRWSIVATSDNDPASPQRPQL